MFMTFEISKNRSLTKNEKIYLKTYGLYFFNQIKCWTAMLDVLTESTFIKGAQDQKPTIPNFSRTAVFTVHYSFQT